MFLSYPLGSLGNAAGVFYLLGAQGEVAPKPAEPEFAGWVYQEVRERAVTARSHEVYELLPSWFVRHVAIYSISDPTLSIGTVQVLGNRK